jgi:hypothetical protein
MYVSLLSLFMKNELLRIKEKLIANAKKDLLSKNLNRDNSSYVNFLENVSNGKCNICGKDIEIVYVEESDNSFKYKFACGHAYSGFTIRDSLNIMDSIKMRKSLSGTTKFILETISGWFPSKRKDLSPKGVIKLRIIDREKDYYKEEVRDCKTGRLIRYVEEKLSDHKK